MVGVVSSLAAVIVFEPSWGAALLNLGTEVVGAVATYFLLEWQIQRRVIKEELIARLGSHVRDVAVAAAEQLREKGWHSDGSLQDAVLIGANLRGAILPTADLQRAMLTDASLVDAVISGSDLYLASLLGADLQRTLLGGARLECADLTGANLREADLCRANLQGALLRESSIIALSGSEGGDQQVIRVAGANLEEATLRHTDLERALLDVSQLTQARSLAGATLPDGTKLSEDNWRAEFEDWRRKQEERAGGERDND